MMTMQEIKDALEDCESGMRCSNSPFSQKEEEMIESFRSCFDWTGQLSDKQCAVLEDLWDKV